MTVKTYDASEVEITIGGVKITGYGDGEFISVDGYDEALDEFYRECAVALGLPKHVLEGKPKP